MTPSLLEYLLEHLHAFPTIGDFCHLIIFAKNLDPGKAPQNAGHDLDTNCLTLS